MRALVYDRYGPPSGLRLESMAVPEPAAEQVLVKVACTSLNLSDWESLVGSPLYARIGGLRRPRRRVLGSDIAGVVEAVGPGVDRFEPGDRVYADNLFPKGGLADYAVVPTKDLALIPAPLSFAQASTIPQAGAIADQGTRLVGPGTAMLINGAGGGSGTFAIQLAKSAGAHVTAVDNEGKLDHMRALGADEVIDYRQVDFTTTGQQWDEILDLVATRSVRAYRRALAPGGRYRCVGGSVPTLLRLLTAGTILGRLSGRRIGILGVHQGPDHFGPLGKRCAAGEVSIHIDRIFALDEAVEALTWVGEGRAKGKAVVRLAELG